MVERRDEVEGDGLGARAFSRIGREEARAMARRARGEWGDEEARRAARAAADDAVTREREAREARGVREAAAPGWSEYGGFGF